MTTKKQTKSEDLVFAVKVYLYVNLKLAYSLESGENRKGDLTIDGWWEL